MKGKDDRSSLGAAVEALELELLHLERLTEQALRHPLNSEKHLQSTAASLQSIGGMEERLRNCMGQLMGALQDLGSRQQARMQQAAERADELKARHDVFTSLMQRYGALGASAGELQEMLQGFTAEETPKSAALPDVVDKLASLVAESEALEALAEQEDFIDLVRYARSLRQQLASAHVTMLRRVEKLGTQGESPPGPR